MISFGSKYWFLYLLAVLIAAAAATAVIYFRNRENEELTRKQLYILTGLRFLSFFLVAVLLLSPFIKTLKKITREPLIILAWDNSASLTSSPDSLETTAKLTLLRDELKKELPDNHAVLEYTFGESAKPLENYNFSEKKSDYGQLLRTIVNNHFNDNIAAVIIAGDGIYNQGKNPVNMLDEVNFPVYTLGLGDSTEVIDSRIQEIRVNRTTFAGNKFPVEIDTRYSKLKGKPLKISVLSGETEVASAIVTPPTQNFFHTQEFIIEAGTPGLKRFVIKTETVDKERNTKNNQSVFVINVLDKKQKVLILSEGPHPDIGAIRNTLDEQTTYDVSVFTEEPYPADLKNFNLLILNQLPTNSKSVSDILSKTEKDRIPTLFIVGNKTFIPQFNTFNLGAGIKPLAGTNEEAQAVINPIFASYSLSEELREIIPRFPPLQVPFADFETDAGLVPLFYQRILNIETNKPLLAAGTINGRKTGFIFGEGIWRWRLYNFSVNQSHVLFNEFVNQLVQYLALRQNEANFVLNFNPVYSETDEVIINAEVYNDVFERITTPEVKMKITNSTGEDFDFVFDVRGKDYYLNAGNLPTGDYSFSAEVEISGKGYTEKGSFTVIPVNFENADLKANFEMLSQLAVLSGGKFYNPQQIKELAAEINNSNRLVATNYFQEMISEILNLKWVFALILLLLSMEWFLRKFWGIY